MSSIEWTDETWNPITGCKKVSPGCANCYAESIAKRFWGERKFTDVQFHPERLDQPLKWRKPRMVFVNSMSDLFHESVTDEQLDQVFAVMALTPWHTYQVLTKRPERMLKYLSVVPKDLQSRWVDAAIAIEAWDDIGKVTAWIEIARSGWPLSNVWLGVSVENQATADERIPLLLQTPAAVRFLSCEPLLEDVNLNQSFPSGLLGQYVEGLPGIGWVIVGGESGHNARPCDIAWIRSIVEQCKTANVPCFVKQLGHRPYLDDNRYCVSGKGNIPDEWPECIRVRQTPSVEVTA